MRQSPILTGAGMMIVTNRAEVGVDMSRMVWCALGAALGLWVLAGTAAAQAPAASAAHAPEPPTAADFFRSPDLLDLSLSPSGRWLAFRTSRVGERLALGVMDLTDGGKVSIAAHFDDADIRSFHWIDDEWLVFDVVDLQQAAGRQRFNRGLFSVRRDGSSVRALIELNRRFLTTGPGVGREPLRWNHALLHVPRDGSQEVIVGEYSFDNDGIVRDIVPKRLNVLDGRVRSLGGGAPDGTFEWWFDATGRPRVTLTQGKGRQRLYWRPRADAAEWSLLADYELDRSPFRPRFFDADGHLYVTVPAGPAATEELRRFDFDRRAPADEALVRTPGFDFRGNLVAEWPGAKTLGVRVETDAVTTVWFDERLRALQAELDQRLPGRVNQIVCRRCGEPDMVALVHSYSDREPGLYLVYQAKGKALRVIGRQRSGVDPARMALVDFHRIQARDGLELPVWVTAPPGKSAGPRPMVVLVHGGPWVRGGHWRWEPMAQFLASRGYLVVEPEFRGSDGYGDRHQRAGMKQWGQAMQDDVADAALWAIDKGLADRNRVCIAGASYGGYSTLMGLVRHPELYRCGAAWVAVTDPKLLFEWSWIGDFSDDTRQYTLPTLLGDPAREAERFTAISPVAQAHRIKAPLMLTMGGLDRRVPLEHGLRLKAALEQQGRAPQWHVYHDEGHGWLALKNRVDFAERLERFLATHLQAR